MKNFNKIVKELEKANKEYDSVQPSPKCKCTGIKGAICAVNHMGNPCPGYPPVNPKCPIHEVEEAKRLEDIPVNGDICTCFYCKGDCSCLVHKELNHKKVEPVKSKECEPVPFDIKQVIETKKQLKEWAVPDTSSEFDKRID
ncbi:hypothetical protein M0R04_13300, partial [Candidatus Dojkabacteria bacterium]|nr:hypothetical protein [Candidatus Dojkabacteria bacterium]